jgi:Flp pilus assembly protein TadD
MRCFVICAVLALSTAAVYWQVRSHEFVGLDDPVYVTDNEHVLGGLSWRGFVWAFKTNTLGNWHPLTWLSLMADCHFFPGSAAACHTTNMLLHIANALLLFWVLRRMTGAVWPSAFVAAAFALHPLHVESVAWVSERKDVLSTFFWMLTMWVYVRYTERMSFTRYLLIALFFALGLMAKSMLVTLPFVLLLLDYWPLQRLRLARHGSKAQPDSQKQPRKANVAMARLVGEKVPLFVITAIFCTVTYLAQQGAGAVGSVHMRARIGNSVIAYGRYITMMFWPSKLAAFYPYPEEIDKGFFAVSAVCLLLVTVMAILLIRRRPYLAVGWLWYLGTLVPVIGLVKLGAHALADRYTYVPLTGLFIMIAWTATDIAKGVRYREVVVGTTATLVTLGLAVCTWFQVGYWNNSIVLFEHALAVTSSSAFVHNSMGVELADQRRWNEASEHFRQALQIAAGYNDPAANLGAILVWKGQADEAIRVCREYLPVGPADHRVHKNLADAIVLRQKIRAGHKAGAQLTTQDRSDLNEAVEQYRQSLELRPDAETHCRLAKALALLGDSEAAIGHYREALKMNPDHAEARRALGAGW